MKPTFRNLFAIAALLLTTAFPSRASVQLRVKTANGVVEGVVERIGVRSFKGVPFGAPPVGDLRWKPPQPVKNWSGVRKADVFAARCMQRAIVSDMNFRADGMSEDCLYLNIWTAATTADEMLPVLVYFFGGGFVAGDGSEPRYDGESMARKGIVTISISYRLSVFGLFAHPELTKESAHHASGNYALFDQHAALQWVQKNIAAFGGNPQRVTIAGESAGSAAVSAQMASPLSKNLIAAAIGESGSMMGALSAVPLAEGERTGVQFAAAVGKTSLTDLRAIPAVQLLEATAKPDLPRFSPTVDGYFFPKAPAEIFAAGEQAHVPLLAGSNSEEMDAGGVLGQETPTVENYRKALQRLYYDRADEVFKYYPATNETEVLDAARALASDRFIAYSTWKWIDLTTKTGGKPTYYYLYARPRPSMRAEMGEARPGLNGGEVRGQHAAANVLPPARGASHSAEIEYALGNLDGNKVFAWTPDDYKVSNMMQEYFANFIKTGNPNGIGLPNWPSFGAGERMVIDVTTRAERDRVRARYEFLDQFYAKQ